ncbi:hypothetical protein M422DRAFT_248674 [Sphaerobolus stellatus SS14]|nr:hypothetical protein M422DRAFT_248674 [Sphaerobolus stellatus SS14]
MVIDPINGTEYFYDLNAREDRNTWSEVSIESDSTESEEIEEETEDASKVEYSEESFQGNTDIEDEIKTAAEENIEQSKEDDIYILVLKSFDSASHS